MPRYYTPEYARVKVRAATHGMTFAQLAGKCGVSRQALEMSLKAGRPALAGLERLAGALNMDRDAVLAPLKNSELIAAALWYAGLTGGQR